MSEPRNFKEKYYRLREKFDSLSKQRDELKHSLDVTKHKVRKLKEENNQLLDLMMDMNPSLADDVSNSSSEELLSDMSTEDEGVRAVLSKYEHPQRNSNKGYTKMTATRRNRTSSQSALTSRTGKRKFCRQADEDAITEEPPKKRRQRQPGVKKKRDDRTDAKRVEPLPMNSDGTLKLPVTIGKGTNEVSIFRIGEIVWDREAYHTNRYIFPVGFMSQKQYLSAVDVSKRTTYTSEILDGGDQPIFQVTAEDQPGRKFVASSSSGVWKKILDEINVQGVPSKTHASGPEMLGLSHLGITKYIQELPGAEKCSKYVMQRWIDDDLPTSTLNPPIKQEDADDTRSTATTNGHKDDQPQEEQSRVTETE